MLYHDRIKGSSEAVVKTDLFCYVPFEREKDKAAKVHRLSASASSLPSKLANPKPSSVGDEAKESLHLIECRRILYRKQTNINKLRIPLLWTVFKSSNQLKGRHAVRKKGRKKAKEKRKRKEEERKRNTVAHCGIVCLSPPSSCVFSYERTA